MSFRILAQMRKFLAAIDALRIEKLTRRFSFLIGSRSTMPSGF